VTSKYLDRPGRAYVEAFRDIVTDRVTTNVAIEARAGHPQGLTNRSFEGITGALIMANWDKLSKLTIDQAVARICGTEQKGKGHAK
jgi:hypothetical protein